MQWQNLDGENDSNELFQNNIIGKNNDKKENIGNFPSNYYTTVKDV